LCECLPHQRHLDFSDFAFGRDDRKVDAAGQMASVPDELVCAWQLPFVNQHRHLSAEQIINNEFDLSQSRQRIRNGGRTVERIRIILRQREIFGQKIKFLLRDCGTAERAQ